MILLSADAGIAEEEKKGGHLSGSTLSERLQHDAMVYSTYRYLCTRCLDTLPEFVVRMYIAWSTAMTNFGMESLPDAGRSIC